MEPAQLVHPCRVNGKLRLASHLWWLSANDARGWDFLGETWWYSHAHTSHACFSWIAESFAPRPCSHRVWIGIGIHNQKTAKFQQQKQQQTATHVEQPIPIDSRRGRDVPEPPRRVKQKRWSPPSTLVMHPTVLPLGLSPWPKNIKIQEAKRKPRSNHHNELDPLTRTLMRNPWVTSP